MCGIAGLVRCGNQQALARMTAAVRHRGPDDSGVKWFSESNVGLGHQRLSIIDLSELGHQPMSDSSGRYWIVFNGEIYNFGETKQLLEQKGYHFRSRSDTEVILASYQEWGPACLNYLNGMFAFAIWDEAERTLFAARDRIGVKPFYYSIVGDGLVFSSEIKSILAGGVVKPSLDEESLDLYLTLQYVPAPKSMFRGIVKLLPGHYLTMRNGTVQTTRYWEAPYGETMPDRGLDAHCEEFKTLLDDAVKIRMISDVPIGAFLSGGIDSSIVVGLMAKHSSLPVQTYSVGFEEGGGRYDELRFAKIVSDAYQTNHRVVVCNSRDATKRIPELVYYLDEPVNESLIYPYNEVSRLAKGTSTVVLTGEGADEFLHGYRYYSEFQKYSALFDSIPTSIRSMVAAMLGRVDLVEDTKFRLLAALLESSPARRVLQWGTFFDANERGCLLTSGKKESDATNYLLAGIPEGLDAKNIPSFIEHRHRLVDYILMRSDKMSMETALECRSPFLDYRVVEHMVRLPIQYKNPRGVAKRILREAYKDLLPEEIVNRRKKPFSAPIHSWLYELSSQFLRSSSLVADGVLRQQGVDRYLQFDATKRANHGIKLWILVMLEIWYRHYFKDQRFIESSIQSA